MQAQILLLLLGGGTAPSSIGLVTGYLTCVNQDGSPQSGIPHTLAVISLSPTASGLSIDTASRTVVSGSGQKNVQFVGILPGSQYTIQRGSGPPVQFEAPECSNVPPSFPIPVSGATT